MTTRLLRSTTRGFELTVRLCRREENLGSKVGAAFKLRNGIE